MTKKISLFTFFLVLAFAVYGNALNGPFMLDDRGFFKQFSGHSILSHFAPAPIREHAYYRPLALVVPHLNFLVFKNHPLGYHVVNVLLLAAAAFCLLLLLSLFMPPGLALTTAVLFMVHPINAVMVNSVTASVFSLQVIGISLCLYFLIRPRGQAVSRRGDLISALFFILALLCYETSLIVPGYALVLCLMQADRMASALRRTQWLWGVLVLYMAFRAFNAPFSQGLSHASAVDGLSLPRQLASVFQLLSWYFQKLFMPVDIFPMWSKPFVQEGGWGVLALGLIFILAVGWALRFLWTFEKRAALFMVWFFLGLCPIFWGAFATPLMGALLGPQWFVAAGIGFFAAAVLFIDRLLAIHAARNAVFACVALSLTLCAWRSNALWSDEAKLYERWTEKDPEFKAIHYFLGKVYRREGRLEDARAQFLKSIVGRDKDWIVYLNIAQMNITEGRLDEAAKNAQLAFSLQPWHTDVLNTLGAVAYANRDWDKSIDWFQKALEANPYNLEPRMNLALVYLNNHQKDKAMAEYRDILKIAPDFAPARTQFNDFGMER